MHKADAATRLLYEENRWAKNVSHKTNLSSGNSRNQRPELAESTAETVTFGPPISPTETDALGNIQKITNHPVCKLFLQLVDRWSLDGIILLILRIILN
jgi:hypothetical protein